MTIKRLDSFSQLLREIEEEQASPSPTGARVSLIVASIQRPKVQTPTESEVEKVQRLVKKVEELCRKVDRRVVVRHRVTFWFGVFLHAINLVNINLIYEYQYLLGIYSSSIVLIQYVS